MNTLLEEFGDKIHYYYQRCTNEDFKSIALDYYVKFSQIINSSAKFKELNTELNSQFTIRFLEFLENFCPSDLTKNIFPLLKKGRRSIKFIVASIMYTTLQVHYDIDNITLMGIEFARIIDCDEYLFLTYLRHYTQNKFTIDESYYYKRILYYYNYFIEKIDGLYSLRLTEDFKNQDLRIKIIGLLNQLRTNKIDIPKDIFNKCTRGYKEICKIFGDYGFDIKILFENNQYFHVMPQYIVLVLIYFFKDKDSIKSKTILNLKNICDFLSVSYSRVSQLFRLLK